MPPLPDPVVVRTAGGGSYELHFDALARLPEHLAEAGLDPRRALVVTDANVAPLYLEIVWGPLAAAGWRVAAHVVPAGEGSKSFDRLHEVYDAALAAGVERGDPVLALGGGVVGDLAGFAAATLLRGLPLVHLPTSLLAQVDSAIGGKTGVNHARGKNLVGAFHPPRLVLADPSTLSSLPDRELYSGLAEAVKHALLDGPDFVHALDSAWARVKARDPAVLSALVRRAAAVKAAVVSKDEREAGPRAFLNLGHTFGHAIERAAGYGVYTHGEAVALGLRAAIHLSASLAAGRPLAADIPLTSPFDRADALAARLPCPARLDAPQEALDEAMGMDKKRTAGALRFVVLEALGWPRLATDVPPALVAAAWERARLVSGPG